MKEFNIVIIDDVFPHPISGFRYQEFISYLKEFESVKIFTSGASVRWLGNQTIEDMIIDFKKTYPNFAGNLEKFKDNGFYNTKCDLLYFVFLSNAYNYLGLAECRQLPFIFTLYPGGAFALNNPLSDTMLRRVVSSPYFRRVIVTQKVTYDYLINNKFCTPEQIEYIFGVVTPLERLEKDYTFKLSPNIPGRIFIGSFDGFPTASCTDAGIGKVAIFCTDQLNLNNDYFIDGEEIVIIEYDIANIIEKISYYYDHPEKLRSICEQGYNRIKEIYCYEKQIRPRIDLITKELHAATNNLISESESF